MVKLGRVLGTIGLLAAVVPSVARADGFKSWRVCGGDTFATCAAVNLSVQGTTVNVQVWNLSGNHKATFQNTWAGTVFNGIGFYNVPAKINAFPKTLSMSGPARGSNTPGLWTVTNNTSVAFLVDIAAKSPGSGGSIKNGISSGCALPGQLPGFPTQLYQNPCNNNLLQGANYVTFSFKISGGNWDPTNASLVLRGYNGPNGINTATECWTDKNPSAGVPVGNCNPIVTPEPVSMTLLATGLLSMGGMGLRRRLKKGQPA